MGSIEIVVPPGMYVEVNGLGVVGSFEGNSGAARPPEGGKPWVRVTGVAVLGDVDVQVKPLPVPGRSIGELASQVIQKVLGKPKE